MIRLAIARIAQQWNLGCVAEIPLGEGKAFDLGTVRVAVFRSRNGELYATQASCPHKHGPLADGLVDDQKVVCPLHGYAFELKTGTAVGHACGALRTWPVQLSPSGDILLEVSEA